MSGRKSVSNNNIKYSYSFNVTLERFLTKEGPAASHGDLLFGAVDRHSPKVTRTKEQVNMVY